MDTAAHNRAKYLTWLQQNFPDLYNRGVVNDVNYGPQLGDWSDIFNNITDALPQLAQTYAQYTTAQNLIDLNTQRAKQGLAPLTNVGGQLVPVTATAQNLSLAGGTNTLLWVGLAGVGLLGVFLLARK